MLSIKLFQLQSIPPSSIQSLHPTPLTAQACTEQLTLPYLLDKVTDMAIANQDAGLVIAAAIGTSVVLYVIADATAKLIKALRSNNQA